MSENMNDRVRVTKLVKKIEIRLSADDKVMRCLVRKLQKEINSLFEQVDRLKKEQEESLYD